MDNTFKDRLTAGEALYGTLITLSCPDIADIFSRTGLDYVWIDAEHGTPDMAQAQRMVQAAGGRCAAVVRVPAAEEVWVKKALDTGCDGIVVPQVKTRAEAEAAVRWSFYPPLGERSVGVARAHGYGMDFNTYIEHANRRTALILQIEHISAVENIEDILTVSGVDALFTGPYDLSNSMGRPGKVGDENVQAAVNTVREACLKAKMPLGIFTADAGSAADFRQQGYSLIACSMDSFFIWQGASGMLKAAAGRD